MKVAARATGHGATLCGAKKHQGEGTCAKQAGWGTDHVGEGPCRLHGGSTRSVSKGAGERLMERKARAVMETYGRRLDISPTDALLEEVQWTAGHVAWLRERVQEIESEQMGAAGTEDTEDADGKQPPHPLVWGVTKIKEGGDDYGTTKEAVPSIWLRLYQEERTHLAKVCTDAIRCGIEERRVRLAEKQGQLVFQVIRAILDDLGLSPEQEQRVGEVVPMRLRALAGGSAA